MGVFEAYSYYVVHTTHTHTHLQQNFKCVGIQSFSILSKISILKDTEKPSKPILSSRQIFR